MIIVVLSIIAIYTTVQAIMYRRLYNTSSDNLLKSNSMVNDYKSRNKDLMSMIDDMEFTTPKRAYYEDVYEKERGVYIGTYYVEIHDFIGIMIEKFSSDLSYALFVDNGKLCRVETCRIKLLADGENIPKYYEKDLE